MVRSGLAKLPLEELDILVIENVGNLVCSAEFKVGEDARVMVYSVTEGEEKLLKYPLMFRSADLVLVNKVDSHSTWTSIWSWSSPIWTPSTPVSNASSPAPARIKVWMSGARGCRVASRFRSGGPLESYVLRR